MGRWVGTRGRAVVEEALHRAWLAPILPVLSTLGSRGLSGPSVGMWPESSSEVRSETRSHSRTTDWKARTLAKFRPSLPPCFPGGGGRGPCLGLS